MHGKNYKPHSKTVKKTKRVLIFKMWHFDGCGKLACGSFLE